MRTTLNTLEKSLTTTMLERVKADPVFNLLCQIVDRLCEEQDAKTLDMQTITEVSGIALDNFKDWFEYWIDCGRKVLKSLGYSSSNVDKMMKFLRDEWRRCIVELIAETVFNGKRVEKTRKEEHVMTADDLFKSPENMAIITILGFVNNTSEYEDMFSSLLDYCNKNNLDSSNEDKISERAKSLVFQSSDWLEVLFDQRKLFLIEKYGYSRTKAEKSFTTEVKEIWVQNIIKFLVNDVVTKFNSKFVLDGTAFYATDVINGSADLMQLIYYCSCCNLKYQDPIKEFRPVLDGESPIKKGLRLVRTCKDDDGSTFEYCLTIVKLHDLTKDEYLARKAMNQDEKYSEEPQIHMYNDDAGEQWLLFEE